jgi:HSP20 family protein
MAVSRYEPWSVVSQLQNEINRVFGNLSDADSNSATSDWSPAVDVREYADRFQLLLDVPGVEPKDVEITLDSGVLTVSGTRLEENLAGPTASEAQQQRLERRMGRFHRRFILPDTADAENVNASGRNGVLEILIPKQAKAQPRRITVK